GREGETRRKKRMLRVPADEVPHPQEAFSNLTTQPMLAAIDRGLVDQVDDLVDHAFTNGGVAERTVEVTLGLIALPSDASPASRSHAPPLHEAAAPVPLPDELNGATVPIMIDLPMVSEVSARAVASSTDVDLDDEELQDGELEEVETARGSPAAAPAPTHAALP